MKCNCRVFAVLGVLCVALWACSARAETFDKAQIKSQKDEMQENAQAAKDEEKALLDKISQAQQSGDTATVESLRAQLRAMHQSNTAERKQDQDALQSARQEVKADRIDAKRDRDNNPPGAAGGPGTNWENPPGPKGGPGTSPDRRGGKK